MINFNNIRVYQLQDNASIFCELEHDDIYELHDNESIFYELKSIQIDGERNRIHKHFSTMLESVKNILNMS